MRIVIQRVSRASVRVDGVVAGSIDKGLVLLVGIEYVDSRAEIDRAVDKVVNLRIFNDRDGLMNRSLLDTGGAVLVVSQFTLLGDVRKGRRPSFIGAAPPETAQPMVDRVVEAFGDAGVRTETGVFGASMSVELVNDGPVTIVMEVRDGRVS